MEKDIYKIIIEPLLTEKSQLGTQQNIYFFKVQKKANKKEIKDAVERVFNVKVKKVMIVNVKPKKRIRGRIEGKKSGYKKAIVVLKEGKIDLTV